VEEPLLAPQPQQLQHPLTPQQKLSIFFTLRFAELTPPEEEVVVEEDLRAVEVEEAVEEVEDLLRELLPHLQPQDKDKFLFRLQQMLNPLEKDLKSLMATVPKQTISSKKSKPTFVSMKMWQDSTHLSKRWHSPSPLSKETKSQDGSMIWETGSILSTESSTITPSSGPSSSMNSKPNSKTLTKSQQGRMELEKCCMRWPNIAQYISDFERCACQARYTQENAETTDIFPKGLPS
jgi:hypothetical protein